jgi:hypothetical protein
VSAFDVIDRLTELGCAVRAEGEKLKVRGPNLPEVAELVSELRGSRDRDAAIVMLRDAESNPLSIDEVQAALPAGVRLVFYQPKQVPFAVAPVCIVTNAGKFYRRYLADLARRLERPEGYQCPPLADILAKLADAGLELQVEKPGAFVNPHGLLVDNDDLPF